MKRNKQKAIAILFVAILVALIPLGAAAPSGSSESATVKAAQSWIGVKELTGDNSRSGIDCSHLEPIRKVVTCCNFYNTQYAKPERIL